ncbi:serine protease [Lentisphaerota bacterium ZTH]|nr:trypsin-like peptidase domain-containing protein [Lentisphaerota bacterium]WET06823.1 serine protease [Lentisphaerota bacterium ZTH]
MKFKLQNLLIAAAMILVVGTVQGRAIPENGIKSPEKAEKKPAVSEALPAKPVRNIAKKHGINGLKNSIVKIFSMCSNPNYYQPWQNYGQSSAVGSGFVIEGNRILTNAHIVANQTFMLVRKPGTQKKYIAQLEVVGHECDLAVLTVSDPEFFSGIKPLKMGDLPDLQSSVIVLGFPIGGDNISVTEGVISRIEPVIYSHSGRRLLAVQIDAAINPGNSGGPVIHDGQVVGVAFQGLSQAQSIGFMIPIPVIKHFLHDVKDGKFDGFPDVPFEYSEMENPDLRKWAGMKPGQTGIIIRTLPPEVKESGEFKVNDVVLAIDGTKIDNNATVDFRNGEVVFFGNLVWRKYIGDNCTFTILRGGKQLDVVYKLRKFKRLVPNRFFDRLPTYYFVGGMLFVPLTINYLDAFGKWYKGPFDLVYLAIHGKISKTRQQVVVLSMVLADKVNVGYQDIGGLAVTRVNGRKIKDLRALISEVQAQKSGYVMFEMSNKMKIVLDINKLRKATPQIMERYRIPADRSKDLADTIPGKIKAADKLNPASKK